MNIIQVLMTITNVFVIYILIFYIFIKEPLKRAEKKRKKKEREDKVSEVLEKYVEEDKKEKKKDKYSKVSNLIANTEKEIRKTVKKKIKVAESTLQRKEKKLMKKGSEEYSIFASKLHSAMPRTEDELEQDIEDLQETLTTLDSIDKFSEGKRKKKIDVGLGIFYDKMVRKFQEIIQQNNLDDFKFIPIQRFKYHVVDKIKNLKDDDFLHVLNIMKETNLIQNLIEVNPTLSFILFSEEKLDLSKSEKVILTFVYDEDILTIKKLLELTQWSEEYALKTLKELLKKNLLGLVDDLIKVESFEPLAERKKWNQLIKDFLEKEKQDKEKKFQKRLLKRQKLKEKLEDLKKEIVEKQSEEIIDIKEKKRKKKKPEIKFDKKPTIKDLPKTKSTKNKKKELNKIQEIKDKDSLIGAMEELDKEIKYSKADEMEESKKENDLSEYPLKTDKIPEEITDIENIISEIILKFDENYSMINGGFIQYEKICNYILQESAIVIKEDLIKKVLNQLLSLKMITNSFKIGKTTFYIFKDLKLKEREKELILFAINKNPMKKEQFINELNWDDDEVLRTMKSLQDKGILRLESNQIILPGIIQEEQDTDFIIF